MEVEGVVEVEKQKHEGRWGLSKVEVGNPMASPWSNLVVVV